MTLVGVDQEKNINIAMGNNKGPEKGVWIASHKIINSGLIQSKGKDANTTIISDDLQNTGRIENIQANNHNKIWYKEPGNILAIIGIIITIIIAWFSHKR